LAASTKPAAVARFGDFELDLRAGQLNRHGIPLKVQPQPAKVLALLVSRAGEVVTREELVKQVWGSDTFVDFEQGLNFAIRQIRTALGDDADQPRFVETLPKRGYRFIAAVQAERAEEPSPVTRPGRWIPALAGVLLLLGVGAVAYFWPRLHPPPRPTVLAVLPFDDLSPQPEEYLVDSLTEEMIARLTSISPELKVIARTSAMQYLHTKKSAREIGEELQADYILENSIRHEGSRLRITAQLVRTSDQTHLWAENYDREMRDLLPLEAEVTEDIAQQIHVRLASRAASPQPSVTGAVDPDAHQLYLKGRYYFNQRSRDGLQQSIQLFSQAIAKDPHYAVAYAGLADAYNLTGFYGFDPSLEVVSKAKIAAEKALQLDDRIAAAHAARAYTEFMWRGDWSVAEKEFQRALDLDDNYVPAHQWYALYLAAAGRMEEALREIRKGQRLDPLSPAVHAGLAYMNYFSRNYDQAIQDAQTALQLNPDFTPAHAVLGWAYTQQKKFPDAVSELQTAAKLSGGTPVYECALARVYALAGNKQEAQRILAQVNSASEPMGNGTAMAAVYLALGDSENALHWLEITAPGDIQANWLRVDPAFDALKDNPRFRSLLNRIGNKNE